MMIVPHTLAAACALDLLAGDPEWMPHPVRLIGRGITTGERFVRLFVKSPHGELIGGALLSVAVVGASYTGARALIEASHRIDSRFGWFVEVALAWTTLAMRSLDTEARGVVDALDANDLAQARRCLSRIVGRDTADLDEQQIARAAIETVAESTCDGIIAPLFYLTLGGVPLAFAYKAVNTLDSMIGHKEHPYFYFGRAAARIDDAANYLPARLTALLLVASAGLSGADAHGAWQVWRRDGSKHASPNAGQSEAAMAGALRVRLGGTNRYDGIEKHTPDLNTERDLPTRQAARQSLRLALTGSLIGCAVAIALCSIRKSNFKQRNVKDDKTIGVRSPAFRRKVFATPEIPPEGGTTNLLRACATTSSLFAVHGGDTERIAREHSIPLAELLDFSANINPAGPPSSVLAQLKRDAADINSLMRYPDIELTELRSCLSTHVGVERESIIVGSGAAALIDSIVRALFASDLKEGSCVLPVPAFSEYLRALTASNIRVVPFPLQPIDNFNLRVDEITSVISRERPRLIIITNPHNPSGTLLASAAAISEIVDAAHALNAFVLLDEAFIDYCPKESLSFAAGQKPNLIVLRSLTKFYGMPALRVGYGITNAKLAAHIANQIPSWTVTTLAVNAAVAALGDRLYEQATRETNERERERLRCALTNLNLRVFPSAANFLLIELPSSSNSSAPIVAILRERLIVDHRIIVRDCSTYEGLASGRFMRVAVRARADNERLVEALRKVLSDC